VQRGAETAPLGDTVPFQARVKGVGVSGVGVTNSASETAPAGDPLGMLCLSAKASRRPQHLLLSLLHIIARTAAPSIHGANES
jgi:hypothetical protein